MTNAARSDERKRYLVSQLLDGVLNETDALELNELLHADHALIDSIADQ